MTSKLTTAQKVISGIVVASEGAHTLKQSLSMERACDGEQKYDCLWLDLW